MLRKIAGERWKKLTCEERKPYYEALVNRIRAPRRKRARDLPDSISLQELVDSAAGTPEPCVPEAKFGPDHLSPSKLQAIGSAYIIHNKRAAAAFGKKTEVGAQLSRLQACCYRDARLTKAQCAAAGGSRFGLAFHKKNEIIEFDKLPGQHLLSLTYIC